ncbi:biotin carboxylase N-terminal domain-containing protein [Kribbella sp. DT2]
MISSVLVANRGEIARRVFATARALGLGTVAVHSTADALAPYVGEADAAVHLPGNAAVDTYLQGELLIAAARAAGADAVHPGYGFLSENAAFAAAVLDAGLTWIGPPVAAIAAMGSKIEAKKLMAAAGVPVLRQLAAGDVTDAELPVLVKASAGGGGRGMRVVESLAELRSEIASAEAEALSAFGDGTVFCEPYLASGRHIEVQVLADSLGTVWVVGERECSIQRRHQKVVEESPSPLVERVPGMRSALFEAARKAAEAIGYVGAGTVEFLADESGKFYFLEMNTRLQVEHPVTESVTGLDLVALQFSIAAGERLPAEPPEPVGHSIEMRLYAEDPAQDWQPQTGLLHRFAVAGSEFTAGGLRGGAPWVRVDSGVTSGSEISPYYDSMLAKVIVWAPTREVAARRLAGALERAEIHGVATNRDLLVWVLRHPAFVAGDTDTGFFDKYGVGAEKQEVELSALAAALADAARNRARAKVQGRLPSGWRNLASQPQRKSYAVGDSTYEVSYRLTRDGLVTDGDVKLVEASGELVVLEVGGVRRRFEVAAYPGLVCVGPVQLVPVERFADPADQLAAGSLVAPMPGSVIRVAVEVGDEVQQGQALLWLEAMKMEHTISAPADGVVVELNVAKGEQVEVGAVLAVVRGGEDA